MPVSAVLSYFFVRYSVPAALASGLSGVWLALVLLFGAGSAQAAGDGVAQLKQFVVQAPQASGRFSQTLVKGDGATARPSTGVFAYARPGKFRWDIQRPYEQLIVTDGTELYFFDKDLEQVTIRPVSEAMSATPAALLFGSGEIDKSFTLSEDGSEGGLAWVLALPQAKDAGFERLRIGMRAGLPARMEVFDAFGQQTRFDFEGIDPKAVIAPDQFRFTPPAGVDIVR